MYAVTTVHARTESGEIVKVGEGEALPETVTADDQARLLAGGAISTASPETAVSPTREPAPDTAPGPGSGATPGGQEPRRGRRGVSAGGPADSGSDGV